MKETNLNPISRWDFILCLCVVKVGDVTSESLASIILVRLREMDKLLSVTETNEWDSAFFTLNHWNA